jgi:ABC-type glutathione transport system ATPase component
MRVDTLSQVPASQLGPDGATSAANNAAPKATALIKTKGLVKTFTSRKGAVEAVRGVDLEVREGEIFGFL